MPGLISPAASSARSSLWLGSLWLGSLWLGVLRLGSRLPRESADAADDVDPDYLVGQMEFDEG